jgi:hypothetical protein
MKTNKEEIKEESQDDFNKKKEDVNNILIHETPDIIMHRIEEALLATGIISEGLSSTGRPSELGSILGGSLNLLRNTLVQTLNWLNENFILVDEEIDEEIEETENDGVIIEKNITL